MAAGALATLTNINGIIQIGLVIGEEVVPIAVGAVKDLKAFLNDQEQIEYTVVMTSGKDAIQRTIATATDSLTKINAERAKAGLPAIPVPGTGQ